ncbi:MAG: cyclic nucleotide-binding domain-containing protein [Bdellovibrionota bacterium]
MSQQKAYKKGEFLFREGDKISQVVFIQSGSVNLCLTKGKKSLDLFQLGANQLMGEMVIFGQPTHQFSAIATTDTKTFEVTVDAMKQQYEAAPQLFKMTIKSLSERLKQAITEVRSARMEKDSSPCPEDQVAKVFGIIFHTASHKGEKQKDNSVEVLWPLFRQYSLRIFGESLKRLEQACHILVKLKLAQYTMGKAPENPDGQDEVQAITFKNLAAIEAFFEFYQYYYFKGGKSEILKPDDLVVQLVDLILKLSETVTADRFGLVSVEFAKLSELVKSELGTTLNNDHFARMEAKGAMTKRRSVSDSVRIEFEPKELKNIFFSWKILREIEKWNEKGFVDLDEKEEKRLKKGENACPQCNASVKNIQKFCAECGHSLVVKAS